MAQAWAEQSKMGQATTALDTPLLEQVESQVVARLSSGVTTTSWVDHDSTPPLVRTIIAMLYISWLIDKLYSEDEDLSSYAGRLAANAESMIMGIIAGDLEIPGVENSTGSGQPSFYPNDNSSAALPTAADPSLGPAMFSMGSVF
jgi:hypothetical protein